MSPDVSVHACSAALVSPHALTCCPTWPSCWHLQPKPAPWPVQLCVLRMMHLQGVSSLSQEDHTRGAKTDTVNMPTRSNNCCQLRCRIYKLMCQALWSKTLTAGALAVWEHLHLLSRSLDKLGAHFAALLLLPLLLCVMACSKPAGALSSDNGK